MPPVRGWERAPLDDIEAIYTTVAGALGIVAFWGLVVPRPQYDLGQEFEHWFFVPEADETAPVVVLLLAAWLLYRRRRLLQVEPGSRGAPSLAAAPLGVAILLHGWATYTGANDLLAPALIALFAAAAAFHGGASLWRALALPCALLVFVLPLPPPLYNVAVWKLQIWTAQYAQTLLAWGGYEPALSGDLLRVGDHMFIVIEACSGFRGIEILTMISLLIVDLFRLGTLRSALLVLCAPAVAFAMNGVRVAWIASLEEPGASVEHTGQGILTLLSGCLALYGLAMLMERRGTTPPRRTRGAPVRIGPVHVSVLGILAVLSLVIPRADPVRRPAFDLDAQIPKAPEGWTSRDHEVDYYFLGRVGFREVVHRSYRDENGTEVELFSGVGTRIDRRHSPRSPKTALPRRGWTPERWLARAVPQADGSRRDELVVAQRGARRLVWRSIYGDRGLLRESLRSLTALDASGLHDPEPTRVLRLSTPLMGSDQAARRRAEATLARFRDELRAPLMRALQIAQIVRVEAVASRLGGPAS